MRSPVQQALSLRQMMRNVRDVRNSIVVTMLGLLTGVTLKGWRVDEETDDVAGEIRLRRVLFGQFLRVARELIHEDDRGDAPILFLSVGEYISSADSMLAVYDDGVTAWIGREYFKKYSRFVG